MAGAPRLEATSKVVGLKIGDQTITVPDNGTGQEVIPVGLLGLLQVTLNAREQTGTATSNEQSLTRRASIRRVTFGSAEVQLPRRAIGFVKTPVERPKQQLLSRKLRSLWVLTSPIRHHGHSAFSPAGGPARRAVRS